MSTATTVDVIGTARDRVDGRLKVMGAATYPIDLRLPGMAHAVLAQSTVTSGRIRHSALRSARGDGRRWDEGAGAGGGRVDRGHV
jgi:CO/xanthine dehydrogenase Mo-binding subunit